MNISAKKLITHNKMAEAGCSQSQSFPFSHFFFSKLQSNKMISTKKLVQLARKWHKLAAIKRRRITLTHTIGTTFTSSSCSTFGKAEKGGFVVYSADHKRFLLPLEYLNNEIIRQLFDMAEEEFGLPGNGPLTLPCDSQLMEYAISLIKRQITGDVERALLISIASCSSNSLSYNLHHQSAICSF